MVVAVVDVVAAVVAAVLVVDDDDVAALVAVHLERETVVHVAAHLGCEIAVVAVSKVARFRTQWSSLRLGLASRVVVVDDVVASALVAVMAPIYSLLAPDFEELAVHPECETVECETVVVAVG